MVQLRWQQIYYMQDLIFFKSLKKKRMQLNWKKKKNRSKKRTQIQYIKLSHNRLMMAVKNKRKKSSFWNIIFNNVETLKCQEDLYSCTFSIQVSLYSFYWNKCFKQTICPLHWRELVYFIFNELVFGKISHVL